MENELKYRRILLKLSGEALSKGGTGILNHAVIDSIVKSVKKCAGKGAFFGIVVGGGNIWRGKFGAEMDRVRSDKMGMLGTVINALAFQDVFESNGMRARVMTAADMSPFIEAYSRDAVLSALAGGEVCIFGCGTGSPYFTTDTGAVLRAAEMKADIVLLAKNNTDAIYDSDPNKNPNAKKIKKLSYSDVIINNERLQALDATAASLAMVNGIPLHVVGIDDPENIFRAVIGEEIGTVINREG